MMGTQSTYCSSGSYMRFWAFFFSAAAAERLTNNHSTTDSALATALHSAHTAKVVRKHSLPTQVEEPFGEWACNKERVRARGQVAWENG